MGEEEEKEKGKNVVCVWRDPKFQGKIRLVPCVHIQHNFFLFFESRSADRRKKKTNLSFFFVGSLGNPAPPAPPCLYGFPKTGAAEEGRKGRVLCGFFLADRSRQLWPPSLPPPLYPRRLWLLQEKRGFGGGGGIWRLLHRHPFLLPPLYPSCPPFCCSRVRFTEKISYKSRGMLLFPLRFC